MVKFECACVCEARFHTQRLQECYSVERKHIQISKLLIIIWIWTKSHTVIDISPYVSFFFFIKIHKLFPVKIC